MRAPVLVFVVLVLGLLVGCAPRRILRITSDPPGATIRIDDKTVGVTPLDHRYYHYGVRRVTIYKDGYRAISEQIDLDPVWYARFPIDVVSELLLPFGWRDRRAYHVPLVAGDELMSTPSLYSVIQRADVLRHAGPEGPRDLPTRKPRVLPPILKEQADAKGEAEEEEESKREEEKSESENGAKEDEPEDPDESDEPGEGGA